MPGGQAIAFAVSQNQVLENNRMATWEYKVVELESSPSTSGNERILNALGRDGWELVAVAAIETAALKRRGDSF
jgi:hypothetical protein